MLCPPPPTIPYLFKFLIMLIELNNMSNRFELDAIKFMKNAINYRILVLIHDVRISQTVDFPNTYC